MARAQAIKYQNTEVEATKSAQEIMALVAKYGATRFELQWTEGLLTGVRFALKHDKLGEVPVRMAARTQKIEQIIADRLYGERRKQQAYRIAWRQLKDFIEQQLLAVQTGLFPVHEVFMAQIETRDPANGEMVTMGELLNRHATVAPAGGLLFLPAPPTIDADFRVEG